MKKTNIKFILLIILFLYSNLSYSNNKVLENMKEKKEAEIELLKKDIIYLEGKIKENKSGKKDKLKVGLALSGGGTKGLAHVGVLRNLEENNIKIDYIAGTSIGAFIGVLYSAGYSFDEMEKILSEVNLSSFLKLGADYQENQILENKLEKRKFPLKINYSDDLKFILPKALKNTGYLYLKIKKLLVKDGQDLTFEDLNIPVRIVTTNLDTGKSVTFERGDLAKSLTAGLALPIILEPVKIGDSFYVDGGIKMNLPVNEAFDMGADIVIASNISSTLEKKSEYNIIEVMNQVSMIQTSESPKEQGKKATILITPDVKEFTAASNIEAGKLIKIGEAAAIKEKSKLDALPKNKNKKREKVYNEKPIKVSKIEYSENIDGLQKDIIDNSLEDILHEEINGEDLEKRIIEVWNLNFVSKVYYNLVEDKLVLDIEVKPENAIGLGYNYDNYSGAKVNVGGDYYLDKNFYNKLFFDIKLGEYLGFELGGFTYLGLLKKYNLHYGIDYDESPFRFYEKGFNTAVYKNRKFSTYANLNTNIGKKIVGSAGVYLNKDIFNLKIGTDKYDDKMNSKTNLGAVLNIKYDSLNYVFVPNNGIQSNFNYNYNRSLKGDNSSHSIIFNIDSYSGINEDWTLMLGANFGFVGGDNLHISDYIKIGGNFNNINNRNIAFNVLPIHKGLTKNFASLKLGLRYKLYEYLYLSNSVNIAYMKDINLDNYEAGDDISLYGFSTSVTYDSPIGPIDFSVLKNNREKSPSIFFSIGYTF